MLIPDSGQIETMPRSYGNTWCHLMSCIQESFENIALIGTVDAALLENKIWTVNLKVVYIYFLYLVLQYSNFTK